MALAVVRSKAVVLLRSKAVVLLLIVTHIVGFCFFVCYFVSILVLQSSRWGRESWLPCFVFLVSRDSCVALPHDATVCLQFVIVVFPDHTHYF